ncbi:quinate 5-dehydrogenase [Natroniella sulfidigena]|uniref:quinate 5-dehydrogenase n=1 Tax=Natroniella sulfidigena TaxID=723921 RepID=UPI00200A6B1B|nr:quinate 5-dehydrogenase [Natroniella sulfidigena]MCK8816986.1 quinate 5-dehydrogenase [Natroniella sulfidigena]
MKRVVSISLGASSRDRRIETDVLGKKFIIERIGTDGDLKEAIKLFKELDGQVDAFGLGGMDLYLFINDKKYIVRDAQKIIEQVEKTPIVDGSGLKRTLESDAIKNLDQELNLKDKKVLVVSALDRFGMAKALQEVEAEILFGDLMFALGLPIPIKSFDILNLIAKFTMPLISRLPFKIFYPTGKEQDQKVANKKYEKYYHWADIIAGDFHYIKHYLPSKLTGKIILTNTITVEDLNLLKERGVSKLITTTPEFKGRSFGTNLMEAILVALLDKPVTEINISDYLNLLQEIDFKPRVIDFNQAEKFINN